MKGKIIGFEECMYYVMENPVGEGSPFRLLSCTEAPVNFVVVNPYHVVEDYSFEIEDSVLNGLFQGDNYMEDIAVLCVVRADDNSLYVNLRSPLIVNTRTGTFVQTILPNETYGVSVPFTVRKAV